MKLSSEMGKASLVGLWWLNIGQAELALEQYEPALQNTQKAIARFEALGNQRMKAMGLIQQTQILLEQGRLESAEHSLTEALRISEPIQEKILLFESCLLQGRLWSAHGEQDKAQAQFEEMLTEYDNSADQARLHYHLWRLSGNEKHKETAVTLYQQLLTHTPNYQYQKHLTELLAA